MAASFRRKIISSFKLHGLQLRNNATSFLADVLEPYSSEPSLNEILDQIIEAVQRQPLKSTLVPQDVVEAAVEECNQASDSDADKALTIISAFDVPAFQYNTDRKKFLPVPQDSLRLHGPAQSKALLFLNRFSIIHQHTLRHELFSTPTVGQEVQPSTRFQLKTVEHLLSSLGNPERVIVLGMLVQLKESKFHLEDPTGSVELDISQCTFHTGLFVESSIVLAEGTYKDNVFRVTAIGFPPIETQSATRSYFGNVNFFGGPSPVCAKASVKLHAMLEQNQGAMLVFLSDVFLDDAVVLQKLNSMFAGYSDSPPTAFVFMGNFLSAPYGASKNQKLRTCLKALGDVLAGYPELLDKSQFCFVPGPQDPGPGNVLPRPSLPTVLMKELADRVPNIHFCSNPCRIQFCSKEIVVFREDILNKMSRHCVRFPSDELDMPNHFVKTILSQAHLCPLPLHSRPVYWMYDHALRLYPLPDLLVVGDKCDSYSITTSGCTITNPGSFPRSRFEFKVYVPSSGAVEDSKIMD